MLYSTLSRSGRLLLVSEFFWDWRNRDLTQAEMKALTSHTLIDARTGKDIVRLDDRGLGANFKFSPDERTVYFRTDDEEHDQLEAWDLSLALDAKGLPGR